MRRLLYALAFIAFAVIVAAVIGLFVLACGCVGDTWVTAARFSGLRADHTQLRAFLRAMPKGADLHVHLSGAVYAEDFIAWAAAAKLCVQRSDYKIVPPDSQQQCDEPRTRPAAGALTDQSFYDDIVNALSMRNYIPSPSEPSGHDQFFVTFGKYGEISWRVPGQMTALLLRRYAAEHVQHTELMITLTPQAPQLTKELLEMSARPATLRPSSRCSTTTSRRPFRMPAGTSIPGRQQPGRNSAATAARPSPAAPSPIATSRRSIATATRPKSSSTPRSRRRLCAPIRASAGLNFVGPEDYRIARADYRAPHEDDRLPDEEDRYRRSGAGRAARGRAVARAGAAGRSHLPHPRGGRNRRAPSASATASRSPTSGAATSCSPRCAAPRSRSRSTSPATT